MNRAPLEVVEEAIALEREICNILRVVVMSGAMGFLMLYYLWGQKNVEISRKCWVLDNA